MTNKKIFQAIKYHKEVEFACSFKEINCIVLDLTFDKYDHIYYTSCINKEDLVFLQKMLYTYGHNLSGIILCYNRIHDECVDILIKILGTNRKITYINLSGNNLSILGVQKLLHALSHTGVTNLDLSANMLPFEPIMGHLRRKLINPIVDAIFKQPLGLGNSQLQELDISSNIIDHSILKILIDSCSSMMSLQKFSISGCKLLKNRTKIALFSWLKNHPTITDSDIHYSGMDGFDLSALPQKPKSKKGKKQKELTELEQFKQYLYEKYNMAVVDVPSDGNCFFHAVTTQLRGSIAYDELRKFAVRYVKEHKEHYASFLVDATVEEYITKMLRDATWADHSIIDALARELQIRIVIIGNNPDHPPTIIAPLGFSTTIFLGHIGELHYVSLNILSDNLLPNLAPHLLEAPEDAQPPADPYALTPYNSAELEPPLPLTPDELDAILGAINYVPPGFPS